MAPLRAMYLHVELQREVVILYSWECTYFMMPASQEPPEEPPQKDAIRPVIWTKCMAFHNALLLQTSGYATYSSTASKLVTAVYLL